MIGFKNSSGRRSLTLHLSQPICTYHKCIGPPTHPIWVEYQSRKLTGGALFTPQPRSEHEVFLWGKEQFIFRVVCYVRYSPSPCLTPGAHGVVYTPGRHQEAPSQNDQALPHCRQVEAHRPGHYEPRDLPTPGTPTCHTQRKEGARRTSAQVTTSYHQACACRAFKRLRDYYRIWGDDAAFCLACAAFLRVRDNIQRLTLPTTLTSTARLDPLSNLGVTARSSASPPQKPTPSGKALLSKLRPLAATSAPSSP